MIINTQISTNRHDNSDHHCTHSPHTYFQRLWLIDLIKLGYSFNNHCVELDKWLACPPLIQQVLNSSPVRVIPKTIIKMVRTASLHGTQCV